EGTFSLARYRTSRACTTSGARLPSCVNSVGRPSLRDCQAYASARRPSACSGLIVRIQTISALLDSRFSNYRAQLPDKTRRVIIGVEDEQFGRDRRADLGEPPHHVRATARDGEPLDERIRPN